MNLKVAQKLKIKFPEIEIIEVEEEYGISGVRRQQVISEMLMIAHINGYEVSPNGLISYNNLIPNKIVHV